MPNQEFFFVWSIATFLVAYCWMWTWMPATTVILVMLTLVVVYSVVAILLGLATPNHKERVVALLLVTFGLTPEDAERISHESALRAAQIQHQVTPHAV